MRASLFLQISFALCTIFGQQAAWGQLVRPSERDPSLIEQLGLAIPMRDGIRLAADIFLPKGSEEGTTRWPTILVRTPYNRKTPSTESYRFFAKHGFAVVVQDVRGRFASQGLLGPTSQEGPDGNDTINWIARQPWSDGKVGMAGSSYLGIAQWWAAEQDNPHLVTISPMCSGDDEYRDRFYSTGGALQLGHRLLWLAQNLTPPSHVRPLFESYISHLPLITADIEATGVVLPPWRQAVAHPSFDDYWKQYSVRTKLRHVRNPVLSFGGWFDEYVESDLDAFSTLAKQGTSVETWIGPWSHDPGWRFPTRDFGKQAALPIRIRQLEWFNRWMKTQEETASDKAEPIHRLHLFVMGPNVWREEQEWPLARARATPFYLDSRGDANSASGGGMLQIQPVRRAPSDSFNYDPAHPVATTGGAICCDPQVMAPGPLDQSAVEKRRDVLVYTSTPLREELEVTGMVQAVLYVATSANDTDFTAKLVDVEPSGRPLLVTDGIQRMRYRLSLSEPVFVKRNNAYQISIDAGVTSYVFAPGHSIRLEVSSSNFPRFDRNLNSVRPVAEESKTRTAKQTVFHERAYPSVLILPVVPRARSHERRRPGVSS